jgi:hypothetical protein
VQEYEYFGNTAFTADARYCIELYYKDYRDCYCVNDNQECFFFEGPKDCGEMLTTYNSDLSLAVSFDLFCFLGVLALSVVTSISICCPFGFRRYVYICVCIYVLPAFVDRNCVFLEAVAKRMRSD